MKKYLKTACAVAFLSSMSVTFAQELAITERGDSVYLYANGRWDYKSNLAILDEVETSIKTNSGDFKKAKEATKKVTGVEEVYAVWFNDKNWKRIPPADLNPEADIAFQTKNGGVYAMVIFEELEVPLANLTKLALDNAITVAPDLKIVDRDYRMVNGKKVIWMRMDGTVEGMKISYYSYYFSNQNGSIQFHTFTGQSLVDKYQDQMDEMLNGLVILD